MNDPSSDDESLPAGLFDEPDFVRPQTPPPSFVTFTRSSSTTPKDLSLRLVGSHPLWGHYLWNASKVFARYIDEHHGLWKGCTVLELGAGAALPSLLMASSGSEKVVITDYPDKELIDNIWFNVRANLPSQVAEGRVIVQGYVWGTPTKPLADLIHPSSTYDIIILSDLIFNHSQHHALLRTCRSLLTPKTGSLYVFFTHHKPRVADRDLKFFEIAKRDWNGGWGERSHEEEDGVGYGFSLEKIVEVKETAMFEDDEGDLDMRRTVHGWRLWLDSDNIERI